MFFFSSSSLDFSPGASERRGRGLRQPATRTDPGNSFFSPLVMAQSNPALKTNVVRPVLARSASNYPTGFPAAPIAATLAQDEVQQKDAVLELADGTAFRGISFGAEGKSVAGECVFQTGTRLSSCSSKLSHLFDRHRHGWIHGVLDGPFLRRPDPHLDLPPHRKLRSAPSSGRSLPGRDTPRVRVVSHSRRRPCRRLVF